MPNKTILRLPDVMGMLGVSKPTIYLWIKGGGFPAPLRLGPKASGWLRAEIEAWIDERAAARKSGVATGAA